MMVKELELIEQFRDLNLGKVELSKDKISLGMITIISDFLDLIWKKQGEDQCLQEANQMIEEGNTSIGSEGESVSQRITKLRN